MTEQVTLTQEEAGAQSLAAGTAGTALLHIEQALTGDADWQSARTELRRVMLGRIDAAEHSGLFYGASAVAFVLHAASAGQSARYHAAVSTLDHQVLRLARRRLVQAENRIRSTAAATFAEYDLFYGLTGIGVYLLRHHPTTDVLADLLSYVTRLTRSRREGRVEIPGWWVGHDPDSTLPTPGGHANFGLAHGAAGLLALLGHAARRGVLVPGQLDAIDALQAWFDRWRQDSPDGAWWPEWVTQDEMRTGRPAQQMAGRPSWCYGAVGIARAQQIAALATDDQHRRQQAEAVIAACLTTRQIARLTEPGLCHGVAGLYQTAFRAAADANDPAIRARLPVAHTALLTYRDRGSPDLHDPGLLTGRAGLDLALSTARSGRPPISGWDACLLIS
jgi:hypothetical protein